MKPTRNRILLHAAASLALTLCASHATEYTWNGSTDGTWDTTNANWDLATGTPWDSTNGIFNLAIFNTADLAATVNGTVDTNGIKFSTAGTLSGGTITLGGTTPTITTDADGSIASILAGSAGLTKAGTGTLTLSGANTYTGDTSITSGILAFSGTGASNNNNALLVGGASGRAVLNFNSSGTFT